MEFKKVILVLVLFSGILGCECFNAGTEWNIKDFAISIVDNQNLSPVNGVIEGDSAQLIIIFEAEFVEATTNPLKGLINSAYATSCEEPGDDGLKDEIASFIVTSNSDFNGIEPGGSLNEKLAVYGRKPLEQWISSSASWMFSYDRMVELIFIEKPEASSTHIFTVKIEMESGKIIEQNTDEIQWN
ncbi:MAG: hypothetical protein IT258_07100 [Saprospiraceae bacterium]|nr:hypothetical protein [Saprospiraceae bacterium]